MELCKSWSLRKADLEAQIKRIRWYRTGLRDHSKWRGTLGLSVGVSGWLIKSNAGPRSRKLRRGVKRRGAAGVAVAFAVTRGAAALYRCIRRISVIKSFSQRFTIKTISFLKSSTYFSSNSFFSSFFAVLYQYTTNNFYFVLQFHSSAYFLFLQFAFWIKFYWDSLINHSN